jgi:Cation efflux family
VTDGNGTSEEKGTKGSVYGALVTNLLITTSKFVAEAISGSSAILAEGAHSVADTVNQVFLLISLRFPSRAQIRSIPTTTVRSASSGPFSTLPGSSSPAPSFRSMKASEGNRWPEGHGSYLVGYIILGVAFVFENTVLLITARAFRRAAR